MKHIRSGGKATYLKKTEVRGSEVIKQRDLSVGRPGEPSREMPFEQRLEEGESVIFPNVSGRGIPGRSTACANALRQASACLRNSKKVSGSGAVSGRRS